MSSSVSHMRMRAVSRQRAELALRRLRGSDVALRAKRASLFVMTAKEEAPDEIALAIARFPELLPYRRLTIETRWPVDVAVVEIGKRVGKSVWLGGGSEPFVGRKLSERAFKMRPSGISKQPGRPIILLNVEPGPRDGARILVRMRLNIIVALFMTVWLAGATAGALAMTAGAIRQGQWFGMIAWCLPLFGFALIGAPFAFGARRSERLLRAIFASAPALPEPPATGVAYR